MTEKNQAFEQEVNLRDYVSIIMKRKVSVLAVLFAFVIFAAAMGFCTPKTREISMLIEPAVVGVNDSGAYAYVESTPSIKARIDAGAFDLKILRLLGLDPQITRLKFVTYQPKDSILLRLSVIDPEKGEKLGARVLNQLFVELTDYYKRVIEGKQNDINNKISIASERINTNNYSIKSIESNIKLIEKRRTELADELKIAKDGMGQLVAEREQLFAKRDPANNSGPLSYTNAIQQNVSYINQLNSQMVDMEMRRDALLSNVYSIQNENNATNMEIDKLKSAKENIRNVSLVWGPIETREAVGTGKVKKIIIFGILGLIAGIFAAFFMEYWQSGYKNKRADGADQKK